MACTYVYNGVKYNSYQELVNALTDQDMSNIADILFSQTSKQDMLYDKLQNLKNV